MTANNTRALLSACRRFRSIYPQHRPRAVQIALALNRAYDRGSTPAELDKLMCLLHDRYLPLAG